MTEHELMAAKYANTAFAILFERKTTPGPSEKDLAEIARREQARADRVARAEALEAKQAERDKENAERLARGDKPLSERVQLGRGRSQRLSTLLAVAGIAMLASI